MEGVISFAALKQTRQRGGHYRFHPGKSGDPALSLPCELQTPRTVSGGLQYLVQRRGATLLQTQFLLLQSVPDLGKAE